MNAGVGCASGWNTIYGSLAYTFPSGQINNLVQTSITSSSGAGSTYAGNVTFQLKNYDLDPDNSLGGDIIDLGVITGGAVSSNSTSMQDNSASPDGVNEYFSNSTLSNTGRSGVEIDLSVPVDELGFFLGDVETTTANNGSNPFTPAIVVAYDNTGNELERKTVSTATPGGNCTGTTTAAAVGCGSQETVWVDFKSSSSNIAKVIIIVGDYVSDPGLSPNAGADRGRNEYLSFGGFTLGGGLRNTITDDFTFFWRVNYSE